ncbi:hypothetical protein GGS23DRAFT_444295 [Durotheca rogersii]|uniref:uncharacterized protein n=1 Tax=Durotheca rogersii TaxID=419775 RepID=UPI00222124C6|nr:uncharacterized protein GGS23DRAFT_444295 [Durotheca rogersii]KAI5855545.1 hypothetical protein GGS23DRAFT_444295 [Durotheca rogersii]
MRVCRYFPRPRPGLMRRVNAQVPHRRPFHCAKAQFITIDDDGLPVASQTEIRIGEPHEAYVYIEPDISNAIRSSITRQTGMGLVQDLKKLSLDFNHKSLYFAHKAVPYPRLEITQNLPRQNTGDTSPATLWLSGNWHALTLDGTPDEDFERASRDSAEELKDTLEALKHT